MQTACYQCGENLEWEEFVPRTRECPSCYASVRCCRMCKFYDKSCYNECREPSAERVTDKEKANFCDYFKLRQGGGGTIEGDDKKSLLEQADALFKD